MFQEIHDINEKTTINVVDCASDSFNLQAFDIKQVTVPQRESYHSEAPPSFMLTAALGSPMRHACRTLSG
jgi:hypothetical protein